MRKVAFALSPQVTEEMVGTMFQAYAKASEGEPNESEQPGGHCGWREGSRGQR